MSDQPEPTPARKRGARKSTDQPKPSLVSAPIAAAASLVAPGLGQMLARQLQRGLILLASVASLIVLFAWRVNDLASRETGAFAKLVRTFERRPLFAGLMVVGIVLLWAWNVWDAYRQVQSETRGGAALFVLIGMLFFVLGWQISEIDLYTAVTELSDTWPLLSRVLWPWEAAVTRQVDMVEARAPILVPCEGDLPERQPPGPQEPYLFTDPACGDLSDLDENNTIIPGTEIKVAATNFTPNAKVEIRWEDSIGNQFQIRQDGEYLTVTSDDDGAFAIDVILPYRLVPPSAQGAQVNYLIAQQVSEVGPLVASDPLKISVRRMVETIFLGVMATIFGIVFAVPISFLAARNLMSHSPVTIGIYYITRAILNIVRAIEPLIWVIIAAQWVGLGPFAGIIALTIHSIAALAKLYSESIESIDPGPIEAVQATGATRLQTIMFGVVPQVIPPFVSFSIYRWDINVRMSTVIGLVGGGGIGFVLIQYIRLLNFRAAGIAVWFIAITVAILDYVSAEIRERFV